MGFFSLKGTCDVCGKEYGFSKYKYKDGYLCPECNKKVLKRLKHTNFRTTIAEVKEIMNTYGDKANKCDCCGGDLGLMSSKCTDGVVCGNCSSLALKYLNKSATKLTIADIMPFANMEQLYQEHLHDFTPTKVVSGLLEIDENKGEWLVPDGMFGKKKHPRIFKFTDIVSFELLVDETSVVSGGVGRAVAGGILFGGVGAIVGGSTGKKRSKNVVNSMKIKITVDDMQCPTVYIKILNSATKTDSFIYRSLEKSAQECLSVLDLLTKKYAKQQEQELAATMQELDSNDFIFCRECGTKIPRDSKFCSSCGTKL
ncbi:DUF4428 domain-containing protein [Clostridium baratii]|uniref:DUF4428 domain-containing protein n=1 Tax=Clostridium baratii TaxID=1561 RepID=UPI0022E0E5C2|nr:DUF4428 domain-containing protein [Clostridium baratii]